MTSLTKLLAFNMKERRRILGLSQAALAEKINTSTHYIAMIELEKKTPSLSMIERIAGALEVDSPGLFSMQSIPSDAILTLQKSVMSDVINAVGLAFTGRLKDLEEGNYEAFQEKMKERFSRPPPTEKKI